MTAPWSPSVAREAARAALAVRLLREDRAFDSRGGLLAALTGPEASAPAELLALVDGGS